MFCYFLSQDVPSNEFQITLKLEAVDQTKPETISVATVSQVVGRTIWVRLDGYPSNAVEHIYDMESYDLLPVGWCGTHGHPLLTPHQKSKSPLSSLCCMTVSSLCHYSHLIQYYSAFHISRTSTVSRCLGFGFQPLKHLLLRLLKLDGWQPKMWQHAISEVTCLGRRNILTQLH